MGVNCTAPRLIAPLIDQVRGATDKPIIVYPNSGEGYNVAGRVWEGAPEPVDWAAASEEWSRLGAAVIGGCCRVGPDDIAEIRRQLIASAGGRA